MAEENFADMYNEAMAHQPNLEGSRVMGKVVDIQGGQVLVDVGLKSEGYIPLYEFETEGQKTPTVGDDVEVYVERLENKYGETMLSRQRVLREASWDRIEELYNNKTHVQGRIINQVRGGYMVDVESTQAFLPGSQVDLRPVPEHESLIDTTKEFIIIKMNRKRGNIVISRRAILEEERNVARDALFSKLKEGQVVTGTIKNITNYGAFIDLGGSDGLMHMTDISWKRIHHPSEVLSIGQQVEVKVIRFKPEAQRISLGMKQLVEDPWKDIDKKYPTDKTFTGLITKVTDYGAFTELEGGVEGLIHVSEMSWSKRNVQPSKILAEGETVNVKVLNIDHERRRISLSLKQCLENPWNIFTKSQAIGNVIEGTIRNITEIGLFVKLQEEIDGLVHISNIDWIESGEQAIKKYKKGDSIKAKIIDIDEKKERVALSIKDTGDNPVDAALHNLSKGDTVTATISDIKARELKVTVLDILSGTIRKGDLALEPNERDMKRFAPGERVDAIITSINSKDNVLQLSIKAREEKEQQEALEKYGSSDSGASLQKILGVAMTKAQKEKDEKQKEESKKVDDKESKDTKK